MVSEKIIAQGAEALLIKKGNTLVKKRIKKSYRHVFLDSFLRTSRTRKEAKLLTKANYIINVPTVFKVDDKKAEIIMNFIQGKLLSEHLDLFPKIKSLEICEKIGEEIALLHDSDIIHGDLTTSNMILVDKRLTIKKDKSQNQGIKEEEFREKDLGIKFINDNKIKSVNNTNLRQDDRQISRFRVNDFKVYLIDFGLGFVSARDEDKAVDLHLLHEALTSKHFLRAKTCFKAVLEGYKSSKKAEDVIVKLKKVESRGRYKGKRTWAE